MPRRNILIFAAACLCIAAALAVTTMVVMEGRRNASTIGTGEASVGGPFTLTDQTGAIVDESILEGRWTAVFFGFTHCPDYCPATLEMLRAVKDAMGPRADDLSIVFISVDPERDTPELLADYLKTRGFPEGVVGLTGTPDQTARAASAYRAYYERVGEGAGYTMNHTLTIYLMGPDGRFRLPLSHDLAPDQAARIITDVIARG